MSEQKTEASTVTTITPGQPIYTMINTLRVKPEKQAELLAYLKKMIEEDVVNCPGSISANVHVSGDGTHIINYAQWRSVEDMQAMLARYPEHIQHIKTLTEHHEIRADLTVAFCAHGPAGTQA